MRALAGLPWPASALLLILAFAGCSSPGNGSEGPIDPDAQQTSDASSGSAGATPSTQASSRVKVDPNATFVGEAHMHDWWGSDTEVVVMDRDLELPPGGVCVGEPLTFGCNGAPERTRFIRLESDPDPNVRPNIVFQGTGEIVVKVTVGQVIAPFALNTYGTGLPIDSKKLVVDQTSKTFTIGPIDDKQTDAPHHRISSWYWRLESATVSAAAKGALFRGPLHVEVKVMRDLSRALPVDPPHPDHWNGTTSLVLIEKTVKHFSQTGSVYTGYQPYPLYAYNDGTACGGTACRLTVTPEINHTVPILSGRVAVTLKWTNAASSSPTKPYLEYCAPPENCVYTSAQWTRVPVTEDGTSQRKFDIQVREDQWDSPYILANAKGLSSKWSFRWSAESTLPGSVALFQGDMSWHVEVFKTSP